MITHRLTPNSTRQSGLLLAWLSFFIILLASSQAGSAPYQPRYSQSLALIVGVDAYEQWPHLEYAVSDAREMGRLLADSGFDVQLLLDKQATRGNILKELEAVLAKAEPDARVFLYFAGHGQTEDRPGGGEKGYIVPVDADLYNWQQTMLPLEEISRRAKQSAAKHILLTFDSCYSGLGLTRGVGVVRKQNAGYIEKMLRLRSVQILTAGGRAEQAIEADGHGLFTDHLLAAISGAADLNHDQYVTATEAYATLRPNVTRRSFNRQTPQFGYLEGEGDFVFTTTAPSTEPAAIEIATAIAGIDVWINNIEKGHRLTAGSHRLDCLSGRNRVLIKKGGRTLLNTFITLQPGQSHRLSVDREPAATPGRQPFAMFTIAHQEIRNFSNSLVADLDRDGREEVVTAAGKSLYAFSQDGAVLWKKQFDHPVRLDLVEPYNGEQAIGVSGTSGDRVQLYLLSGDGRVLWHNSRRITKQYQGKWDGSGRFAALADIDNDGREEILAFTAAGYAWKPRGLIVYAQSGTEKWRYLFGPSPQNLVIWKDEAGSADIIFGTYSPGNGNREGHNQTDDHHSYIISIDARGRTNWVIETGEYFTGTRVHLFDLDNDGRKELYGQKWAAYNYRPDEGAVYRIERNGTISARFERPDSIKSLVASNLKGRANALYAADKGGTIYRLDSHLRVTARRNLNTTDIPMVLNLTGVHDYDGDGREDVLFSSYNRDQQGSNPRTDRGPKNTTTYTNMKYRIISHDLERDIREVSIAEQWDTWRGFRLLDVKRPEMRQYPFVALSDKVTFFNN